ncbi:hypothetical protein TNCV_2881531 [Trichonephila clavipes]|nr:hypothetical protein TNCV_2881531 [Trichonephila clavipes]
MGTNPGLPVESVAAKEAKDIRPPLCGHTSISGGTKDISPQQSPVLRPKPDLTKGTYWESVRLWAFQQCGSCGDVRDATALKHQGITE